jgi:predicted nuclease of predicted toxin-antitoxin system
MITFLADESFTDPTADLIQSWGYTVKKAREEGLSGAKDSHVFEVAQRAGWVLLTADKDFGDIRIYPPSVHIGVIVLRITPRDVAEGMAKLHAVLQKLLAETREEEYLGTLFIVDRNKYRKRKRP